MTPTTEKTGVETIYYPHLPGGGYVQPATKATQPPTPRGVGVNETLENVPLLHPEVKRTSETGEVPEK